MRHQRSDGIPKMHDTYLVDWLRPGDMIQIVNLERECFPEPLSISGLIRLWIKRNTHYMVVRECGRVAAYIGFQIFGPAAHTISMAVHPGYRRQRLATLVQETADRIAANRGARWFTGEVRVSNLPQLNFLEKNGWQRIGLCPKFFGNGEDAIVVWHWLDPDCSEPGCE